MWDLWWAKWHWGRFSPSTSVFPYQFHSTSAPLHGKTKTLMIFITGLHNKPQGCSASVTSAVGPIITKKKIKQRKVPTNMRNPSNTYQISTASHTVATKRNPMNSGHDNTSGFPLSAHSCITLHTLKSALYQAAQSTCQ
jgi:hypothetical protein